MAILPLETGQALLTKTTLQLAQDLNNNIAEAQAVAAATEFTLEDLINNIDVNIADTVDDWWENWKLVNKEILSSLELSALYQQGQFDKVRDTVTAVFDNVSEESSLTRDHIDTELDSLFDDVAEHVTSSVENYTIDIDEIVVGVNENITEDFDFVLYQMELNKQALIDDNVITRTIADLQFDGLKGFVSNALSGSFDSISSIIGGLGSVIEFLFEEAMELLKSAVDIDENTLKDSLKSLYKITNQVGQ